IVEQSEVLVDGLDTRAPSRGRRVDRCRLAIEQDFTFIKSMHAADAFDQGRLAGTIVTKQRENFATMCSEAHALEGMHGAEALLGIADDENRISGSHQFCLPAWAARTRASRWLRRTSASTASTMITPMAIIWKKASTLSRLSAFRITPIMTAPTSACPI